MEKVSIIGLDLAKSSIQVHAASVDGSVLFRRKISSKKLLAFLSGLDPCIVAMEACAGSHHWGREIAKLGHRVKLIAPIYVKPFVKRQKNDAADAEAICEAALRPTMRFVAVKSEEKQAAATVFKVRDLLVRQKTQIINALRGLMAEFGITVPQGPSHVGILISHVEDGGSSLTEAARAPCLALVLTLRALVDKVRELDLEIGRRARQDDVAKRLMSIPGIGPVIATALEALAPPAETFTRGRDFSAWMGLTPRQHSSGGKPRLGKTSKMGQRDLRRLLIIGASAVVRWASRRGALDGSWLSRMIGKKPPMLITVALANRMGRIAWALMTNGGRYEEQRLAA
ncbi:IS110 family transposase [Sinorhizobium meliloti]|uniref:IS110 family transposase n=1 Tax=Rhizobium meliloti TaxID=382 RepID=UPI000FD87095|nr:IS110 family transposase [Sinorhizobium meliloti]RVO45589.1 IS110 family transposase [Sinorhizobium meliloti]